MASIRPARVVVVDASVLINFIHVDRLDILGRLSGFEFVVPEQVVAEVSDPDQAPKLADALQAGHLQKEPSVAPLELEIFAELRQIMGRGEAACLAMAQTRQWLIACDERGVFLRQAQAQLGADRIMNTPGILLLAIRQGILAVEEADHLKDILEHHRFKMNFVSFREIFLRS